jgi:hypothetical protein
MASKTTATGALAPPQIFDCDSLPIPPGTKNHARLPRGLADGARPSQIWWLLGAAVIGALLIGALVGRFLF